MTTTDRYGRAVLPVLGAHGAVIGWRRADRPHAAMSPTPDGAYPLPPLPRPAVSMCACGHPAAVHDFADDEPGPCYEHAGTPDAPECPCDAFRPAAAALGAPARSWEDEPLPVHDPYGPVPIAPPGTIPTPPPARSHADGQRPDGTCGHGVASDCPHYS